MVFRVVHFQYQSGQAFELPRPVGNRYIRGKPCLVVSSAETARGKLTRIAQQGLGAVLQSPILSGVVFFYLYACYSQLGIRAEFAFGIVFIDYNRWLPCWHWAFGHGFSNGWHVPWHCPKSVFRWVFSISNRCGKPCTSRIG